MIAVWISFVFISSKTSHNWLCWRQPLVELHQHGACLLFFVGIVFWFEFYCIYNNNMPSNISRIFATKPSTYYIERSFILSMSIIGAISDSKSQAVIKFIGWIKKTWNSNGIKWKSIVASLILALFLLFGKQKFVFHCNSLKLFSIRLCAQLLFSYRFVEIKQFFRGIFASCYVCSRPKIVNHTLFGITFQCTYDSESFSWAQPINTLCLFTLTAWLEAFNIGVQITTKI